MIEMRAVSTEEAVVLRKIREAATKFPRRPPGVAAEAQPERAVAGPADFFGYVLGTSVPLSREGVSVWSPAGVAFAVKPSERNRLLRAMKEVRDHPGAGKLEVSDADCSAFTMPDRFGFQIRLTTADGVRSEWTQVAAGVLIQATTGPVKVTGQ